MRIQRSGPRVALVCGGFQPREDGVSDYVRRLILALAHDVEPLLVTAEPLDATHGLPVLAPVHDWRLADVQTVARCLHEMDVDVVHIQYAPVAFRWQREVCHLPTLLEGLPVVVTVHELEPDMLQLVTQADAVIATTSEHAQRLVEADSSLSSRLSVVPIGPNVEPVPGDAARHGHAARVRWTVPTEAPLVVFFGFLHPVKGLEYLIRAVAEVRQAFPSVHLVLAGGWRSLALPGAEGDAYRDRLQELIEQSGLTQCVRMTGFVPDADVSALLHTADIVALPFTYGLSFKSGSLLAAFAHGRAVVGTLSPLRDPRLSHGEHLLAVPPRDAHALAEAIRALLREPALRLRLGQAARDVSQAFRWQNIAAEHVALYARCAEMSHLRTDDSASL